MAKAEVYKNQIIDLQEVIITQNQEISPGVHLISWHRKHNFIPGQVVKITLDPQVPPRIYSVCSGNDDPEISVLFNIKEEGVLPPRLAGVIRGMKIWATMPYGSFQDNKKPAWWIATGTGIAPFTACFAPEFQKTKP